MKLCILIGFFPEIPSLIHFKQQRWHDFHFETWIFYIPNARNQKLSIVFNFLKKARKKYRQIKIILILWNYLHPFLIQTAKATCFMANFDWLKKRFLKIVRLLFGGHTKIQRIPASRGFQISNHSQNKCRRSHWRKNK